MKVVVKVVRKTEYTTIVDMSEEKFKDLTERLDSRTRDIRRKAEEEANGMIDTSDWQDDELHSVESVEPLKED